MSAAAIHKDLVDALGSNAMAYSTVTLYLHKTQFQAPDDPLPADEQIEARYEINEAITAVLAEQLFSFIRDINRLTHIFKSTVRRLLTQVLRFIVRCLPWVMHTLSEHQKRTRMEISQAFLRGFHIQAARL
jgi:hypothetical protein